MPDLPGVAGATSEDSFTRPPQLRYVHHYTEGATFFRAPRVEPEDLSEGVVAVLGAPLGAWSFGRNGQHLAPRAIREMSAWFASYYAAQLDEAGYVDVTTGNIWTIPDEPRLFDVGDAQILPHDVAAQTESIASLVERVTARGAMPVTLGGDHYVPYPAFLGFVRGLQARKEHARVGFLNIDGHFDFWDDLRDLGRLNHGTFARRISEHDAVGNMVWWGLNGTNILEPSQFDICKERGFAAYRVGSIRSRGVEETMREALDIASDGADYVYVTFDIDATDGAFASGTNSIVVDGLSSGEVLAGLSVIPSYDVVGAFDVCEMIPQYDSGGGRTARYAAHAIFAVVQHRILDVTPRYSHQDLARVFR